ncbi:MAG: hypothetical protein LKI24_12450 [Acidipropionibacterium sp.]|nr:hypothetical protein [Acidipropionibacterium sp.]
MTISLTVPAVCSTARSLGIEASAAASRAGVPHPEMRTSTVPRSAAGSRS